MAQTTKAAIEDEVQRLRNQVASLLTRNLELQRRLEEFERDKTGVTLDDLAISLVRSLRSAEAAMADEAGNDRRYTIAEMQTSLRGFLTRQGDDLTLRLPRSELQAPPDNLGTLQFTLRQTPPPALSAPASLTAPSVAGSLPALGRALEAMQSAFLASPSKRVAAAANEIVAQATHLLAGLRQLETGQATVFLRDLQGLAESQAKASAALPVGRSGTAVENFHIATEQLAAQLAALTQSLLSQGNLTGADLAALTAALERITNYYQTLFKG